MDRDEQRFKEFAEEIAKATAASYAGSDPETMTKEEAVEVLGEVGKDAADADTYRKITKETLEIIGVPYTEAVGDIAAGMLHEVMGALFSSVDPDKLAETIREAEGEAMAHLAPAAEALKQKLTPENIEQMRQSIGKLEEFAPPIDWGAIRDALDDFREKNPVYKLFGEINGDLAPYIAEEIKNPKYEGQTIGELFEEAATAAELDKTLFAQAVETARAAKAEAEKKGLDVIKYKRTSQLTLSVGKGALRLFDPREWATAPHISTERGQIPGQMSFIPVSYEKKGADEITLYCGMTSDSFLTSLSPEDFFILSFLDDAYITNNKKCSVHWLFKEYLGERPSERQLNDFYKKLEGLASTTLKINDAQIRTAWADEKKGKATKYREIVQAAAPIKLGAEKYVANGQVADATVLIYDRPAVLQADRVAKQITTVPKSLLQVRKDNGRFVSRTARFYRVLFYLVRRIALIKSGTAKNTLILANFYTETGETTANRRALAYNTAMDIIHHFEREGWITGHKTTKSKTTGQEALTFTWADANGRVTSTAHRKRRKITKK